ncbi:integrase family protein [uncultured Pseudacidovorax sp.]|uniref:tyrosine-type recombinase/integrase n=1 Tax=uncultured Pseudacidovorax sp. TaxID=679313 RepID=UPI0025EADB5D|nr:integrase family protein [uncultured Pseudacidovorax sp.]
MSKQTLTVSRVDGFRCPEGKSQAFLWDAKTPGLAVRVTAAGSRSYIFEARLHGQTIRSTIGSTDTWDLHRARTEASRLKVMVDQGIDPREERAAQVEASRLARQTAIREKAIVADAWDAYMRERKPYWSERHLADHVKLAQRGQQAKLRGSGLTQAGPIGALMDVRLSDLTSDSVKVWMQRQAEQRPTVAALAYRLLRAFIRWADESAQYSGLIPPKSYSARNVRDAVPRSKAKHGDVLQREQLRAWFEAVNELENRVAAIYLQGLLITGARREELAQLRWRDVDLRWKTIRLRDKVEGDEGRIIPLTPHFETLLLELLCKKRIQSTDNAVDFVEAHEMDSWVFSSTSSRSGRIQEPRSAHVKALNAAGLPHVSIHGLRRSFGTLAEWCNIPAGVIAQIQGHKPSAIAEKHYRRRSVDFLRKFHSEFESWLMVQAGISTINP